MKTVIVTNLIVIFLILQKMNAISSTYLNFLFSFNIADQQFELYSVEEGNLHLMFIGVYVKWYWVPVIIN